MDTPILPQKRRNRRTQWKTRAERAKNSKLYQKYGIRLAEYNALLEKQGGVCAICGQPETKMQARAKGGEKTVDSLQVDHDHVTGKVRGLLCWRCNVSIVKLLEDRELFKAAAKYLGIKVEYDPPT